MENKENVSVEHGIYDMIAFKKENSIREYNGVKEVATKRVQRPLVDLYSELQFVAAQYKSDAKINVVVAGLQNIKMGLDFLNAIKKAGVTVENFRFEYVFKTFKDENVEMPSFSFLASNLVSIDKMSRVSNGFKNRNSTNLLD